MNKLRMFRKLPSVLWVCLPVLICIDGGVESDSDIPHVTPPLRGPAASGRANGSVYDILQGFNCSCPDPLVLSAYFL